METRYDQAIARPTRTTLSETGKAFPRVQLPGVDRDDADALTDELNFRRKTRMGFILYFIRSGKPVFQGIPGNERKIRRAVGKRQRRARKLAR